MIWGCPTRLPQNAPDSGGEDSIAVNYRAENITQEIPPNIAVCLYRIVQEALRNISRHAGATEVAISLVGEDEAIRLSIRDNGKGFDPGQKTSKRVWV